MTELAKLKRRVKQLERCLQDVRDMATEREELIFRDMPKYMLEQDDEYQLAKAITNRINRTL